jgi:asparagine synthase (glutamine-hydrolysing)
MCGIAGVYQLDGRPVDEGVLHRMGHVLRHRGPDDAGYYLDRNFGLAFRRLSIIDLTSAGHQPMSNADGTLWLVFNGEIYNYRELRVQLRECGHTFRSQCDSEVILHAYEEFGESCLERFNGMFAFAIWDTRRRSLWLARDRLGVKPLFYVFDADRFVFASEIKALREYAGVGLRANPRAIAQYLRIGHSIDDQTWFEGVHKLLPGHSARLTRDADFRLCSYWDPVERYRAPTEAADYPERIRGLLSDSVRLRLRSDVPVGAHLSGGLDSSSVVALMSTHGQGPVHTFSGAFAEGGEYDERQFIRQVVQQYATVHHEVEPRASQLPEVLPRLIWHLDEPTAGPGFVPQFFVCALSAEHGVKVVNGGQGGDELFGGYVKYLQLYLGQLLNESARRRRPADLATIASQAPLLMRQAWSLRRAAIVGSRYYIRKRGGAVYHPRFSACLDRYEPRPARAIGDPLLDEMYNDLRYYLPALLHNEDRTSMAVSIESRIPFLDYRVVELAASIPPRDKLRNGELKYQLRRAMRDVLPAMVVDRRDKRGFPTPIDVWFRGELATWISNLVLSSNLRDRRVFSERYLDSILTVHRQRWCNASQHLWAVANVALWFEQFNAEPTW